MRTIEDILREQRERELELFTKRGADPYRYQLNVGNTVFGALYEYYATVNGIHRPMSDKQRIDWERQLWEYLQKVYYSVTREKMPGYDNYPLRETVRGGMYERIADIVNFRIDINKAIKKLYCEDDKKE